MRWGIFLIAIIISLFLVEVIYSDTANVENEVLNSIQETGEARVIVQLKDEVQQGYGIFSVTDEVNTADVVQDYRDELNISHEYDVVKGFAGEIDAEDLELLKQDNRIERIYYDAVVNIQLQNSRGIINSTQIYNRMINGVNITGANQTICIIDTGINASLNEFNGKVVGQYCFCSLNEGATANCCSGNSAQNSSAADNNGHGTHVAGIAAANGTNGNIIGIAPDAKLVIIKTMNSSGSGSSSDIISGIDYCVSNKTIFNVSVISMSLGSGSYTTEASCQSIDAIAPTASLAVANGIFVVASSGNDASTNGVSFPACAPNVVSVGGTYDADLGMEIFSSCTDLTTAPDKIMCLTNRGNNLDLLAPGDRITSTALGGGVVDKRGTSMAAPHVAGLAALM